MSWFIKKILEFLGFLQPKVESLEKTARARALNAWDGLKNPERN